MKILLEQGGVNSDPPDEYGRTPLSYAATSGHEGIVMMLLERGDVNPDSPDKYRRTPLSYGAEFGHEGTVKVLLGRGDVNPEYLDNDGRTPLVHAKHSGKIDVVRLLSEPRPFSHNTSQISDLAPKVSSPAPSAQEGVDPGPVSQLQGILPNIRDKITEATPSPPPDQSPLNQLQAHPLASALAPISTSHATPDSTISQHSRPPRGCITAFRHILHQVKHKLSPSS